MPSHATASRAAFCRSSLTKPDFYLSRWSNSKIGYPCLPAHDPGGGVPAAGGPGPAQPLAPAFVRHLPRQGRLPGFASSRRPRQSFARVIGLDPDLRRLPGPARPLPCPPASLRRARLCQVWITARGEDGQRPNPLPPPGLCVVFVQARDRPRLASAPSLSYYVTQPGQRQDRLWPDAVLLPAVLRSCTLRGSPASFAPGLRHSRVVRRCLYAPTDRRASAGSPSASPRPLPRQGRPPRLSRQPLGVVPHASLTGPIQARTFRHPSL